MNLEKLLALFCDEALHLSRLDLFDDPWEGVWPASLRQAMVEQFGSMSDVELHEKCFRRCFFVNCWHASDHESAALWEINASKGIAIKTTCRQLKSAVHKAVEFYIGEVSYADYAKYNVSGRPHEFTPAFLKRKSFEHEREVRVVKWKLPSTPEEGRAFATDAYHRGVILPVRLGALLNGIYLSPKAPPWLLCYIKRLAEKYRLSKVPIEQSRLYESQLI